MTIRKIPGKEFFEQPFHARDVRALKEMQDRVTMRGFKTKIVRETNKQRLILKGERDAE